MLVALLLCQNDSFRLLYGFIVEKIDITLSHILRTRDDLYFRGTAPWLESWDWSFLESYAYEFASNEPGIITYKYPSDNQQNTKVGSIDRYVDR